MKQVGLKGSIDRARIVADQLGYLLDEDLQALAGVTASTTDAWRKRGKGPSHIRFGNRHLYPKESLMGFLRNLDLHAPSRRSAKDLL